MWRSTNVIAFALLLLISACGWTERQGDFTYACADSIHPLDAPTCVHRLTEHYMLRYGDLTDGRVILVHRIDASGSAGLIDNLGDDVVRRVGLDDQHLVAQTGDGRIFVAPVRFERRPEIVGPLTEEDFATRYPDAPAWKDVQ